MSFTAQYQQACEDCGGPTKGQTVTYVGPGEIAHYPSCPKPAQICPRCFLEMPLSGECDSCG